MNQIRSVWAVLTCVENRPVGNQPVASKGLAAPYPYIHLHHDEWWAVPWHGRVRRLSRLGIALVASCCRQVLIVGLATDPFPNIMH